MKYLIILLVLILTSCHDSTRDYIRPTPTVSGAKVELDTLSPLYHTSTQIYSYEGCEYIVVGYGDSKWGTHKGNCKNPIHNK
jgi:hypothetical protein